MRFDLRQGIPVITERDVGSRSKAHPDRPAPFHQAIGEMCAFINGVRTVNDLVKFGCFWWEDWVTEEKCRKRGLATGDLGPASYGPGFTAQPTPNGPFDQIDNLINQIKQYPHLRTHYISPWIPELLMRTNGRIPQAVVAPCHGWVLVLVDPEAGDLTLIMWQRSADFPVGVPFNMIGYAALTMMIGQVTGYRPTTFVHQFGDAHLYRGQLEAVEKLLACEPGGFPTVTVDPGVTNIKDFRYHHFTLEDYRPKGPRMKIWTPV
jgi:thymidylate synthase